MVAEAGSTVVFVTTRRAHCRTKGVLRATTDLRFLRFFGRNEDVAQEVVLRTGRVVVFLLELEETMAATDIVKVKATETSIIRMRSLLFPQ